MVEPQIPAPPWGTLSRWPWLSLEVMVEGTPRVLLGIRTLSHHQAPMGASPWKGLRTACSLRFSVGRAGSCSAGSLRPLRQCPLPHHFGRAGFLRGSAEGAPSAEGHGESWRGEPAAEMTQKPVTRTRRAPHPPGPEMQLCFWSCQCDSRDKDLACHTIEDVGPMTGPQAREEEGGGEVGERD